MDKKLIIAIAVIIIVLLVSITPVCIFLDSIFTSDPYVPKASSSVFNTGTDTTSAMLTSDWMLDEALTCKWVNGYNDHGSMVTEFGMNEIVYAYSEMHGPDLYGHTIKHEWWYKEIGETEYSKRWEYDWTCGSHYAEWAQWTWWEIGGSYGAGEGFIAVYFDSVLLATTNLYNIVGPMPDVSITYTMTVLTVPNNCNVNVLGVGVMNSDDGIAIFEEMAPGNYQVTVSKAGYPTFTKTILVDADTLITADLPKISISYIFWIGVVIVAAATGVLVYNYKKKRD